MDYKRDEIREYFENCLSEYTKEDLDRYKEDMDFDLHHEIFNTDYYIIGRGKCIEWLSDNVFNVIEYIKEYEETNFGEVNTNFSEPEHVVNMYVYIIGEELVNEYFTE